MMMIDFIDDLIKNRKFSLFSILACCNIFHPHIPIQSADIDHLELALP